MLAQASVPRPDAVGEGLVFLTPIEARISEIVTPSVEGLGFELVRVMLGGGRPPTLQIMVDRADGAPMSVEDCAVVSRTLSAVLDVADPVAGAYTLEVSSPGVDRPLTRAKDFERWAGHETRVETRAPVDGRRRFKGVLLGLEGEDVKMRLAEGGEVRIPLAEVERAKLVLTDALLDEHRRAQQAM